MKKSKNSTQNKNRILALLVTIFGTILIACIFTVYYDMNDDVLIKDILAGVYTGSPQGRNIQMLYPLAWLISILYRLIPVVPWFGLFLTGSIFVSFWMILAQVLNRIDNQDLTDLSGKNFGKFRIPFRAILCAVILLLLYAGLLLWEMVFVQYTVVCGILAMTAAVYLYLTPKGMSEKEFILHNIPAILLVVIAFNLRTEMLLLMCPFLAIAGLLRWSEENRFFCKESFIKYGVILGSIAIFMLVSLGVNKAAYSSEKWHDFETFFNARTDVYDFTWYPDYDENTDFYETNGISRGQYELICNYNFGIDNRINSEMLQSIVSYQKEQKAATVDTKSKIKDVLWQYRYQLTHFDLQTEHETRMMPYNLLVLILYIWLIIMAVWKKDLAYLWKLPMMWIFRSVPWLYVLWGGRVVARLTHPMYLIEIMILLACIAGLYQDKDFNQMSVLCESDDRKTDRSWINIGKTGFLSRIEMSRCCLLGLMIIVIAVTLPGSVHTIRMQEQQRKAVNQADQALQEYCLNHPQDYFYIDVYSTVSFSEKILSGGDNKICNYDLLGGWFSKSPSSVSKAEKYGITDVTRDLGTMEHVYFIAEEESDISWITLYYQEMEQQVAIDIVDQIQVPVKEQDREQYQIQDFNVYQIKNLSN